MTTCPQAARKNVNPEARFYELDIRSSDITSLIAEERFDIINHHAAQMSVPVSVEDPILDANVNIIGLLNILEAAKSSKVGKVILGSTGGAIYGEATDYPTGEDYVPTPLSPYAITKFAGENYLAYYSHQFALGLYGIKVCEYLRPPPSSARRGRGRSHLHE